jgi:hypothetical protein
MKTGKPVDEVEREGKELEDKRSMCWEEERNTMRQQRWRECEGKDRSGGNCCGHRYGYGQQTYER